MTTLRNSIIGTSIGAAVLAFSALSASAAIVCSGNVCWHTHESYTYPPNAHVIVPPNTLAGANTRALATGAVTPGPQRLVGNDEALRQRGPFRRCGRAWCHPARRTGRGVSLLLASP